MGTITLTSAMRANLLSLQKSGADLSSTQLKLATGNKVNSALDNPVNFFAAQSLNRRASQLSSLLDGMGQAIQTIQSTNQAITTITSMVNQLSSIAGSAKTSLNNTTTVNTLQAAGGSGLASTLVANLTSGAGITNGSVFTLKDGTSPVASFTIATGMTLQTLVNQINAVSGFSASVSYGDGVSLSASSVDANGVANGAVMASGNAYLKVVSTTGQAIVAANITGTALAGLGLGAASTAVKTGGSAANDIASYASVIAQIDQTVTDSNYQGNNLINGTGTNLTVQVNEGSTGAITVTNKNLKAVAGLALDANASTWTSATNIDASIVKINAALNTLATTATSFANSLSLLQTRQDFTTGLINTLQNGATNLTIADKNEEGANLLALQTQQQLGIEALSLSSQANQSVLRLFS